ncbi:MAG: 50S ribosomal protein L10 [Candidatus Thermoplasmatota archaeon]
MSEDVPSWKKEEVNQLTKMLESSPVIGVVNIEGIPARQMQQMRAKLRDVARIRSSKNTFIEKAIERAGENRENLEDLEDFVHGQIALVMTDENPFKLFNHMEKTKTKAPASGGETAPEDVIVEEGETPFKPGPIVGDLQNVGIPASIKSGSVVINNTTTVVEEGETITSQLATMLRRLEINPITVGLDLKSVYEDGILYEREDLDIDPSEFVEDIKDSAASAFALSVGISYPTRENITTLVSKSSSDAMGLAFNADIINEETIGSILSQVSTNMMALASELDPEALDEELREKLGIEIQEKEEESQEETQEKDDKEEDQDGEQGEEEGQKESQDEDQEDKDQEDEE